MSTPPPPPPPPYGPPPYGQPPYGQPPYGQPHYGQPPYGQPPYGPPPYGQPAYPPYGQYPGAPGPPGMPPPPYGYGPQPDPVPGGRRASMGARFGGLVVDSLVIAVPTFVIAAIAGEFHTRRTCDAFTGNCTNSVNVSTSLTVDLVALLIGIVYSAWLVGMTGQTLGHRAAGIRIVDVDTGQLIGPGRGALRWFVMVLGGLLCTVGYWSPFFDSYRRQGWHDKATRSVAVAAR